MPRFNLHCKSLAQHAYFTGIDSTHIRLIVFYLFYDVATMQLLRAACVSYTNR